MDFLPDQEVLSLWLIHYGSFAFFLLLAVGIIALPVPDESLMVLAGILINKGLLPFTSNILAAYLGSICGITISYLLGLTVGHYLIHKWGSGVGLTARKLSLAQHWFDKFGKWTLFIGYFIPGIRHFTGISAGMAGVKYQQFALFAYSGALIWVTTFLSLGYFFGDYGISLLQTFEFNVDQIFILAGIAAILYFSSLFLRRKFLKVSE